MTKELFNDEECANQIAQWLNAYSPIKDRYKFNFILIEGNKNISKAFLQEKCILSYREKDFYDIKFHSLNRDDIIKYIQENVVPGNNLQIDKNVQYGDFGEIIVTQIAKYLYKEEAYKKLRFKLNNKKSAFGTDVVSFDNILNPTHISFYESKVRRNILKKESIGSKTCRQPSQYISVVAYNSLLNDFTSACQPMLDYMAQRFLEENKKDLAKKYMTLSEKYREFDCSYEIYIFTEKKDKLPDLKKLLSALNKQKLALFPLYVTIVLIDDLYQLIEDVWNGCGQRAADLYGK